MQITFDTDNPKDIEILGPLAELLTGGDPTFAASVGKAVNAATARATKKAAAAPKVVAEDPVTAKPVYSEPTLEPEPEPEPSSTEPTLDDAVKQVTGWVAAGNAQAVKAALTELGVERVSKVPVESIGQFLELVPQKIAEFEQS